MEGKRLLTRRDRVVLAARRPLVRIRRGVEKFLVGDEDLKADITDLARRLDELTEEVDILRKQFVASKAKEIPMVTPAPHL